MSRLQTTLSFADLIRAAHTLQPANAETLQALVAVLNIPIAPIGPVSIQPEPEMTLPKIRSNDPVRPFIDKNGISLPYVPPPPTPKPLPLATALPSILEPVKQQPVVDRGLVTPLDLPPPVESSLIVPEPLFRQNLQRGILSAMLATEGEDGPPDIEKLVEQIERGRLVRTIQRKPWPTLRRGVQLLIDQSAALTPFFADQTLLQQLIMQVAGREKTEVLRFSALPDRAGIGLEFEWQPYRPPMAGTPIVMLTDLGIGQPPGLSERATTTEWLQFARQIRRAGCPLLAVLPYARDRCPAVLRRAICTIPWDRHTTAGLVRYLIGKS